MGDLGGRSGSGQSSAASARGRLWSGTLLVLSPRKCASPFPERPGDPSGPPCPVPKSSCDASRPPPPSLGSPPTPPEATPAPPSSSPAPTPSPSPPGTAGELTAQPCSGPVLLPPLVLVTPRACPDSWYNLSSGERWVRACALELPGSTAKRLWTDVVPWALHRQPQRGLRFWAALQLREARRSLGFVDGVRPRPAKHSLRDSGGRWPFLTIIRLQTGMERTLCPRPRSLCPRPCSLCEGARERPRRDFVKSPPGRTVRGDKCGRGSSVGRASRSQGPLG